MPRMNGLEKHIKNYPRFNLIRRKGKKEEIFVMAEKRLVSTAVSSIASKDLSSVAHFPNITSNCFFVNIKIFMIFWTEFHFGALDALMKLLTKRVVFI